MERLHRRTIQKDLNDLDNHSGVITHLESDTTEQLNWTHQGPDILEWEVK